MIYHDAYTTWPVFGALLKEWNKKIIAIPQKKSRKHFAELKNSPTFASQLRKASARHNDSVAQLVEQMTLNHWVESSSLSGVTNNKSNRFQPSDWIFLYTRIANRLSTRLILRHRWHSDRRIYLRVATSTIIEKGFQKVIGVQPFWKLFRHKPFFHIQR